MELVTHVDADKPMVWIGTNVEHDAAKIDVTGIGTLRNRFVRDPR